MRKSENAAYFAKYFAKMNDTDQANFSRICNKLLANSFICADKDSDKNDYYAILPYLRLYQEYFAIMDYEVIHYPNDRVIQLSNLENYNHFNLKLNESVVLLILRKIYAQKNKEISLHENVVVSIEEVHDRINEIGWLKRRMDKTKFRDVIRLFKRFSLVNNVGEIEKDESLLVLYPSILHAVPYDEISDIDRQIREYGREDDNDEIPEEDPAD